MTELTVEPVTSERFDDLAALFGPSGAYSGCWCMWWRIPGREYSDNGNAGNRTAMRKIVRDDEVPGLLAYRDGTPVGWISVDERARFTRVLRSPKLKPTDASEDGVWSIVCFFIHRDARGEGVATALLDAAVDHAAANGATAVEAYPIDTTSAAKPSAELFTGTLAMFTGAGFIEVDRRGGRPTVRRELARD